MGFKTGEAWFDGSIRIDGSIYQYDQLFIGGGGGNEPSINSLINWNESQDASIVSLRTVNTTQDASIVSLRTVNTTQDASIVSLRSGNLSFDNGAVANPSIKFTNEPSLGIYRLTSNTIGFTSAGSYIFGIDATRVLTGMNKSLQIQNGVIEIMSLSGAGGTGVAGLVINDEEGSFFNNHPAIRYYDDPSTGINIGYSRIDIVSRGKSRINVTDASITFDTSIMLPAGKQSAPSLAFSESPNTGLSLYKFGVTPVGIMVSAQGDPVFNCTSTYFSFYSPMVGITKIELAGGTATSPAIRNMDATGDGIFWDDESFPQGLGITRGGVCKLWITSDYIDACVNQFRFNSGNVTSPPISFLTNPSIGIYYDSSVIAFAYNGVRIDPVAKAQREVYEISNKINNFTMDASSFGQYIRCNSTGTIKVTVSSISNNINTVTTFRQVSSGNIDVSATAGVTINGDRYSSGINVSLKLICISTNIYDTEIIGGAGGTKIDVSNNAPSSPAWGDIWIDTSV